MCSTVNDSEKEMYIILLNTIMVACTHLEKSKRKMMVFFKDGMLLIRNLFKHQHLNPSLCLRHLFVANMTQECLNEPVIRFLYLNILYVFQVILIPEVG